MNSPPGADAGGLELPEPGAEASRHSTRLVQKILAAIEAAGGVIGFDEYMRRVLHEPGLGYYSGAALPFGPGGDFVTAPEISPLFGECLAQQLDDLLGQGCAPQVLEFGAGSGKLCAQILASLDALEQYLIIDLGADLKRRQQEYLRHELPAALFRKISWLQRLPEGFDGIVLANEVLDAMPAVRVVKRKTWREAGVAFDGERFCWREVDPRDDVRAALVAIEARVGALPAGYSTELNLNYAAWFGALARACDRVVVFIIDYGYEQDEYYHAQRVRGTLRCHYRHRAHDDPLVYPGLQDVTAFIDFDACADAAERSGFEPCGLVTQAEFLLANGLLDIVARRGEGADSATSLAIAQQVKTLTLPQEMGEKFKVLALQKNLDPNLPAMRRGGLLG